MKKNLIQWSVALVAMIAAASLLVFDFGLGMSPLTKAFIVFSGVILGCKIIPTILVIVNVIRRLAHPAVNHVVR